MTILDNAHKVTLCESQRRFTTNKMTFSLEWSRLRHLLLFLPQLLAAFPGKNRTPLARAPHRRTKEEAGMPVRMSMSSRR